MNVVDLVREKKGLGELIESSRVRQKDCRC